MRLLITAFLLVSGSLYAFENAYITFEHPDGWGCELSEGVWICQGTVEPQRRESIVLSIAASAAGWDTLENYQIYLKKKRQIPTDDGKFVTSEVRYVRKRNINGYWWIDSLQLNSEIPGFWTRYAATVQQLGKHKLAILVTYIVSKEHYSKMAPHFERMVSSLRPKEKLSMGSQPKQKDGPFLDTEVLGSPPKNLGQLVKDRLNTAKKVAPPPPPSYTMHLLIGFLVVIIGFVIIRRKAKKKADAKRKKQAQIKRGP